MGKSCLNFEAPHLPLEEDASGAALVAEAAAALEEPASAVSCYAVVCYLCEGTLALDSRGTPHQSVVPCLEGLRLSADHYCPGLTAGGESLPV